MNNQITELKEKLKQLAQKHQATMGDLDDFDEADYLEWKAEQLIVAYCVSKGWLVNGFPTEMEQLPEEELEEDYFCRERYQLYLDTLTAQHEEVAELTWCYVSSFWPDQFDNKEEYLETIRAQLESDGFYQVTL